MPVTLNGVYYVITQYHLPWLQIEWRKQFASQMQTHPYRIFISETLFPIHRWGNRNFAMGIT